MGSRLTPNRFWRYRTRKKSPVYQEILREYHVIPEEGKWPPRSFDINSCRVAVKSQQLSFISGKKSCSRRSCRCKNKARMSLPNPSNGFHLIEYADKCCSAVELSSTEKNVCKCASKAMGTVALCKCDKSVCCNLNKRAAKVGCVPPHLRSKSCLKVPLSAVAMSAAECLPQKASSFLRKVCSKEIMCKKCQQRKNRKRTYEKCKRNRSMVYSQRSGLPVRDKARRKCPNESFYKVQYDKYKGKYFDLIQRIKCVFAKHRN